jgi:hypothetical protein
MTNRRFPVIGHHRRSVANNGARPIETGIRRRLAITACLAGMLAATTNPVAAPAFAQTPEYSSEQVAIARIVLDVGRSQHAPERVVLAAMEAAMVEANLRADPGRCEQDHDSAGLFQQRRDWVPVAERPAAGQWCVPGKDPRLNPRWAATHFYRGSPGHRGALAYDRRGTDADGVRIRTAGELAQATQVSAYPDRYDAREADARAMIDRLRGPGGGKPNPYTPEQVCGAGFRVIDHADLGGRGTVYLLWRGASQQNCVVTIKSTGVGTPTAAAAHLQPKGRSTTVDEGRFGFYAGPVRRPAPGCVRWGGSIDGVGYTSPWEHCAG